MKIDIPHLWWHFSFLVSVYPVILLRMYLDFAQLRRKTHIPIRDVTPPTRPYVIVGGILVVLVMTGQASVLEILPLDLGPIADAAIRTIGVGLGVIASIFFIWPRIARQYTWASGSIHPLSVRDHRLAVSGPYRIVRHPFYFGCILGVLGLELTVASYLVFVFPLAFAIFLNRVAQREEGHLLEVYGSEYTNYMRQTHRWIPSMRFS